MILRLRCAGLTVTVVVGLGFVEMDIEGSGRTTERRDRSWEDIQVSKVEEEQAKMTYKEKGICKE